MSHFRQHCPNIDTFGLRNVTGYSTIGRSGHANRAKPGFAPLADARPVVLLAAIDAAALRDGR
jgi:hypothetical protein